MVQDCIVYLIVFLCVVYAGRHFFSMFRKGRKGGTGCNCGCSGCQLHSNEGCGGHESEKNRQKACKSENK